MILWIFMGGKNYEFVGIRPLSTSVDSSKLLDPQTIANLTHSWTQPISLPPLDPPPKPSDPVSSPVSSEPVCPNTNIDTTPELPPEIATEPAQSNPFASIPIPPVREPVYRTQELCCQILEELYGVPFVRQARPDFLRNPETGRNCELDCYNERLGLALEYNGEQHYRYPNIYHRSQEDFIKQVRRDRFKLEMCDANNVYLITVPYNVPTSRIRDFIIYFLPENVAARLAQTQPQPQVSQHTL
jgi:hypothetical protein